MYYSTKIKDKELRISAYADNTVRIRISADFEPTLFEKYGIYKPASDCGEVLADGVKCGDLTVTYDGNAVRFTAHDVTRTVKIGTDIDAIGKYMSEKLNGFRPEYRQIIGDEAKRNYGTKNFINDPKYITIDTEGEKFYGLGESNTDRLVLNGRTYLERVVYQRCEIPVPFLMTKSGYGILCNSTFWHGVDVCAKDEKQIIWYLPDGDIDFMIFAGSGLAGVLERFTYVTGRPILLPKWAYGLTFIDQYYADQFEIMRNAEKFRELGLPCDTISLEPGWMKKRYDFSTEKDWNTEKFFINNWARSDNPHEAHKGFFLSALKRYGFKTQLWLCCQHDFTAHEENLAGNPTDFGIEPWFDHLKKFMNDGALSFKVDPCHVCDSADEGRVYANGKAEPEMHNLMQTLCTKEMYYGERNHISARPMLHFCGGYTGSNAYSAATTGDSGGKHKTLVWILNCGLSGISNITCDMEIFYKQTIHYCFFTAWCQLNSWSGFAHPWWAGDEMQAFFTYYDKLRYSLMPYIYSTAINANLTGLPVCRAMPFVFDDPRTDNEVYAYMFGDGLLVGAFSDKVYLPQGAVWFDFWTGKKYDGGQELDATYPDDRGGVLFAKGGAIIPTEQPKQYTDCRDAATYELLIFPAGKSSYTLYEDDGLSMEFKDGKRSSTVITCDEADGICTVTVGDREGTFDGMREDRTYSVRLRTDLPAQSVTVDGKAVEYSFDGLYLTFDMANGKQAKVTY